MLDGDSALSQMSGGRGVLGLDTLTEESGWAWLGHVRPCLSDKVPLDIRPFQSPNQTSLKRSGLAHGDPSVSPGPPCEVPVPQAGPFSGCVSGLDVWPSPVPAALGTSDHRVLGAALCSALWPRGWGSLGRRRAHGHTSDNASNLPGELRSLCGHGRL